MDVKISDEVMSVLKDSRIEGNVLYLPSEKLERKLYMEVNKVLELCNGKWDRKLKGHRFEADPTEILGLTLAKGIAIDEKKKYQEFYTPVDMAKRIVELADIKAGDVVLEPSAGEGALVLAIPVEVNLTCVEIQGDSCKKLRELDLGSVNCCDFLIFDSERIFDKVIMNPPFHGNQDVAHVKHALSMLKAGGTLVSVMSGNTGRSCFKSLIKDLACDIYKNKAGDFKEAGTDIETIILVVHG